MNIDYSEIITKANARKDALQALETRLQEAPLHARQLSDSLGYFKDLAELTKPLDAEGQSMASDLVARVKCVGSYCSNLHNIVCSKVLDRDGSSFMAYTLCGLVGKAEHS